MHRAIYQALRDHDGDAAQAAMSEHLRIAAAFKGTTQGPMTAPHGAPPTAESAAAPPSSSGARPPE
jgi:hypothetical protein